MMEHLTVSEVAALWGCGDEAVRAMIRRGRMPREHFVKRGGIYFVARDYAMDNVVRKNPVGRPRRQREKTTA